MANVRTMSSSPTTSRPKTAPGSCTKRRHSAPTTSRSVGRTGCRSLIRFGPTARSTNRLPLVGGVFFKKADAALVADLRERGLLFRLDALRAQLPALLALRHCAALLRVAELVHPHHGDQRRTASRERDDDVASPTRSSTAATATGCATTSTGRCRATATGARRLPLWRCKNGHLTCVGSRAELGEFAGRDLSDLDPHRPYVDDVTFSCAECGEPKTRVPEVIDGWYDSGSMPFAQFGYPYDGVEEFERSLSGRLHRRGDRPDPRLVLHAHGRRHAGVRRSPATATCCVSAHPGEPTAAR